MHNRPLRFASLFSGCGGFDIGFITEGFQSRGAYDYDPDAIINFSANVSGPSHLTDLTRGVPNEKLLNDIDVLISGPPCQGFSTAGKRLLHDDRNHLLTLTGHLARRIKPHILIVENVSGVLAGEHAKYWTELDATMRLGGYRTHTMRCQATEVGMAQFRKRIFLIAWRTGREMSFAIPKKSPSTLQTILSGVTNQYNHHPKHLQHGSDDWKIAKKILAGQKLCNVRGGSNAVATWEIPEVFGHVSDNERTVLELLRRLRRQERCRKFGDADPVSLPRLEAALGNRFHRLVNALISKGYLRRIGDAVDLVGTFNGKFRRLSWDRPSCAVDTRFGSPRYFLHPNQQRGFTVREAARLQGFKDNYIFCGSENAHFRLIGNAVPPPLGSLMADYAKHLLWRQ